MARSPESLRRRPRVAVPTLQERASGLLLHPTSLPGPHGCGAMGPEALEFLEFLSAAGQRWWQMLPINPPGFGYSPYAASSAFAGNEWLISLDLLVREGWLRPSEVRPPRRWPVNRVSFRPVVEWKMRVLRLAGDRFSQRARGEARRRFERFTDRSQRWLDDYTLYCALREAYRGRSWIQWDREVRDRQPPALRAARRRLAGVVRQRAVLQYWFAEQWSGLRRECVRRGIGMIGDAPFFIAHESADVWSHPELFALDGRGRPTAVAGVPPDYFSKNGQRWGNPLYRWETLRRQRHAWWIDRLRQALSCFDAVRLDHFIAFHRYWEIPASSTTARHGRYLPGPGAALFEAALQRLKRLPLIAEDLGIVTPEVEVLRRRFGFPGMRVLQFSFGPDLDATYRPHDYPQDAVAYTGTHDNDTMLGWYHERWTPDSPRSRDSIQEERDAARSYAGTEGRDAQWDFIRILLMSPANLTIIPVQDLLGLGSEARMNRPGTARANWTWRLRAGELTDAVAARLRMFTELYGRLAPSARPREAS